MNVLVIFSNPPDLPRIRLDKEDKIFKQLEQQFPGVKIDRQHASGIDDVHALITRCEYDVIQFSGHGSSDGIYSHLFGKNPRLQAGETSVLAHVKIPACSNIGPP